MTDKRVCVFDLCGTLVDSNTTFDFVVFYLKQQRMWFRWVTAKILLSFPAKVIFYFLQISCVEKVILLLNGASINTVDQSAMNFAEDMLMRRGRPFSLTLLESIKSLERLDALIVSGSIEPVVKAFGVLLGVNCLSSKLAVSDGVIQGSLSLDIKGQKQSLVKRPYFVISDNYSDLEILNRAEVACIVTKKKNLSKWKKLLKNRKGARFSFDVL